MYGFDVNPDAITLCRDRFGRKSLVEISESGFENYDYPKSGVVIANSSLFLLTQPVLARFGTILKTVLK